ncbi:MAG TPA: hypothetical protein VJS89_02460 [Gammaproteobacteria bacterium]|nr:hypothetical protein [Gammaproteobacteria bacterium]
MSWLLAHRVFSLPWHPDWRVWVGGIPAGTVIVAVSDPHASRVEYTAGGNVERKRVKEKTSPRFARAPDELIHHS